MSRRRMETNKTPAKESKILSVGAAYIRTTKNNVIVTITDQQGNVLCSSSAGALGFKGATRASQFAAERVAITAGGRAREIGLVAVDVYIRGDGAGGPSAVRGLQEAGLIPNLITEISPKV